MEQNCGQCTWFKREPETQITCPQSAVSVISRGGELSPSLAGGSTRPVYGKCKANFMDAAGEF